MTPSTMTIPSGSRTSDAPGSIHDSLGVGGLLSTPLVEQSIQTIVQELVRAQGSITAARPASLERRESYLAWLKRQGAVKGRPPLFPYVGSGLGNGPLVQLLDGSVKWDMINGIGVHMFGHSDPDMVATALRAALSDTVMQGNLQFNADSVEIGELLIREATVGTPESGRGWQAFLTNAGAMANESALKVCFQKKPGAARVIAFADCFMGRSTTMAQIGDSAAGRQGMPLNVLVDYMPFYDPEAGERSIAYALWHLKSYLERYPGQHACFVMELIQGEGGFNVAPKEFLEPLMKLAREHGIPIWIDEVQTFGRTTEMYYSKAIGLMEYADVITIGKMSQVCACLFREDHAPKPGLLSGTFVGSTSALQVGRRALERLRDGGFYGPAGRNAKLQEAFRTRASALVKRHPEWFPPVPHPLLGPRKNFEFFCGVGGMMRLTPFGGDKARVMNLLNVLFEEGVIAFYCGHGPYHLRFLPPVGVMQPEQFDPVFEILERALARCA